MKHELRNSITVIEYDDETKAIGGDDLRDQNNLPAFYNKTSRSCKKAWAALTAEWTPETTMYGAMTILSKNGIRCHSWCRMD